VLTERPLAGRKSKFLKNHICVIPESPYAMQMASGVYHLLVSLGVSATSLGKSP